MSFKKVTNIFVSNINFSKYIRSTLMQSLQLSNKTKITSAELNQTEVIFNSLLFSILVIHVKLTNCQGFFNTTSFKN